MVRLGLPCAGKHQISSENVSNVMLNDMQVRKPDYDHTSPEAKEQNIGTVAHRQYQC